MHTLNHLCCKAAVLTTSNLPVYLKFALQFKSELVHTIVSEAESDMAAALHVTSAAADEVAAARLATSAAESATSAAESASLDTEARVANLVASLADAEAKAAAAAVGAAQAELVLFTTLFCSQNTVQLMTPSMSM